MADHREGNPGGVPCAFRRYEVEREGQWRLIENGIPKATDRIRSAAAG
jgi:hypothetical protein